MNKKDLGNIVSSISGALISYVLYTNNNMGTKYTPQRVQHYIEAKTKSKIPIQVLGVVPSEYKVGIKIRVLETVFVINVNVPGARI